jgi:hypothetical protein
MLIFMGFSLSVFIIIWIIIILLIIRFLLFRMPSFIIHALEVSFGMRVIYSCCAIVSTGMTSVVSVRRMIQRTLVSSLSAEFSHSHWRTIAYCGGLVDGA